MAMAMKEIDVNGRVLSVNPGVTALKAVKAIRDMESLQGGIILENGTRIVLDTEILSELTGRLSFYGGQPVEGWIPWIWRLLFGEGPWDRSRAQTDARSRQRIAIPSARYPWRPLGQQCPFLSCGECPRAHLVDVENAVQTAVGIVTQMEDEADRVPPIVISRVYRGGKTTLIDLISRRLSENRNYYVITVTLNGSFARSDDETRLQALVRVIAYQLVQGNPAIDRNDLFRCEEADLLNRLEYINKQGRTVVLLIDELNNLGVPLDRATSVFLTTHFLDKRGRYLIFSSHVKFHIDSTAPAIAPLIYSSSGRTLLTLPLPFCTNKSTLQNMLDGSVTDLMITLAVGIPSLLFVMTHASRREMSFQDRFDDVMRRHLGAERRSQVENNFVATHGTELLDFFLSLIISGDRNGSIFEAFTTPTEENRLRFPLPYIPIILQFLGENDGVPLFNSLRENAQLVETGRDWELVVVFAIYIRSLASKYCKRNGGSQGPFGIATNGADDVRVITIPEDVMDVPQAVQYIENTTQAAKTIYIFQLAYSRFPDFDGFVSYRPLNRRRKIGQSPTIHGFQCKLTRGYPRNPVHPKIARGWFLRGGRTIQTPDNGKWRYPTEEDINTKLLGFGLRLLHPMAWGDVPNEDQFDG